MKITWLGHSCFKIEKNSYRIITDPYAPGSVPGLAPVKETANLVVCSHEHGDHNSRASVQITASASGSDPTSSPVQIRQIHTFHDPEKGALRGSNTITIFDFGDEKIAHLGDLGCELPPDQKGQLMDLDAILIPVGGFYTIDGKQAAALIRELHPKLTIPMHYRDDRAGYGYPVIDSVNTFLTASGLPAETAGSSIDTAAPHPPIVVMSPQNA